MTLNKKTLTSLYSVAQSNVKGGRMVRVELCDSKLSGSVVHTTATSPDISMTGIRATLTEDGAIAAKKLCQV